MIQPIILAAGKGTRMKSDLPKVLHEVAGKPMLSHLLDTFGSVKGYLKPIVVVGYREEVIREKYGSSIRYATQTDIRGTALAVRSALSYIPPNAKFVLVAYGDQPFLRKETLEMIRDKRSPYAKLLLGEVCVPNFNGQFAPFASYGRLITDDEGNLDKIVEVKNASFGERTIKNLNAGIFGINAMWLPNALKKIKQDQITGEYYLTGLVEVARNDGAEIECIRLEHKEALGINSPEDAEAALSYL